MLGLGNLARYAQILAQKGRDYLGEDGARTPRYDDDDNCAHDDAHDNANDAPDNTNNAPAGTGGEPSVARLSSAVANAATNVWTLLGTEMSPIVDRLYVGSSFDAACYDELQRNAITHVVNATHNLPHFFEAPAEAAAAPPAEGARVVTYVRVATDDTHRDRVDIHAFDRAAQFIARALREEADGAVLVHCMMGRSRSVAVVCYYLYVYHGLSVRAAYRLVRARRPCANINLNFLQDLERCTAEEEEGC
jgi:predicted protein tyrosine phosphatase